MAADIFVGQYYLYPLTVTMFNQWDFEGMEASQAWVAERYEDDRNRTHSIDYSNAERSRNELYSLDSYTIIMEHTLGEEGYLSVLLDYILTYKASKHCKVSAQVPEIYMTNDVVSYDDVDYSEWLEDEEVSPYQIYVEEKTVNSTEDGILEADIEKINGAFLGVHLEAGEHTIHFMFRPFDFYVGAAITLGYLVVFIVFLARYLKRKKQEVEKILEEKTA